LQVEIVEGIFPQVKKQKVDEDDDMFEGFDLDEMFLDEENDEESGATGSSVYGDPADRKEKRSVRAKRRRTKMNFLFNALAADVGLPAFADRAKVLEKTREVLRDLREAKAAKVLNKEFSKVTKPIISILDVANSHLSLVKDEIVTHSPCA
jgi:hypothetical protein